MIHLLFLLYECELSRGLKQGFFFLWFRLRIRPFGLWWRYFNWHSNLELKVGVILNRPFSTIEGSWVLLTIIIGLFSH